ncbi:MAG TPA: hypothetical protein PL141_15765 [Thermoflexales bacterium]|nr:hypothetical protein [Thermoflexales bacterium]HQW35617.1 hypothetical protein [Thermoflexales bacterium]
MKIVNIFILGAGGVGRSLLTQIAQSRQTLANRANVRLEVAGVADSAHAWFNPGGLDDAALVELARGKEKTGRLAAPSAQLVDIKPLLAEPGKILAQMPKPAIVVDTTASAAGVPLLLAAKQAGCGVVLANKIPVAGDLAWWDALGGARDITRVKWETTCGSALPVISTLNTLLDSGDEVTKIEGSLSGTLGYLASQLEMGVPFGTAVREAKRLGYTEPDPRQDLGGKDVARKALILARMLGYRLSMDQLEIESLYPASMDGLSVDEFLREVDTLNAPMAERAGALLAAGKKLRYAALIQNGMVKVGIAGFDPASKLGSIKASDSVVVFTTTYFSDNPVTVSGRGAGQVVTASGVLGDCVSIARSM